MEDLLRVPKYLMPFGFKKSQVSTNLNRAGAGAESGPLVWQKGLSMFSGFGKYCQSQHFELLSSQVFVIAFELPKKGTHHPPDPDSGRPGSRTALPAATVLRA